MLADPNPAHERATAACWAVVSYPEDARHHQEAIDACEAVGVDYDITIRLLTARPDSCSEACRGLPGAHLDMARAVTMAGARMREMA